MDKSGLSRCMAVGSRIITCIQTKAPHQTYNFSVCIRFKLGDSAGEIQGCCPKMYFLQA